MFDFRSPERGKVRLELLGPRSRLAHTTARLKRGRTLVRVPLNRALRKHLRSRYGKFVVAQAGIRSRTGDVQPLQRAVRVARG